MLRGLCFRRCRDMFTGGLLYRGSIHLYIGGETFGFVAQGIEVGIERSVAHYDAHAAPRTRGGFAEDAEVGILLAGEL